MSTSGYGWEFPVWEEGGRGALLPLEESPESREARVRGWDVREGLSRRGQGHGRRTSKGRTELGGLKKEGQEAEDEGLQSLSEP